MLIEETLFGTIDKVAKAIEFLKMYEPATEGQGYYVAFSGGKDSSVVLDLCKRAGVKYDAHYNLTTVDPPELVYFIRESHSEVEITYPEKTMWQLIPEKRLPPTRLVRYCCEILKERGGSGRCVITGVRHQESAKRNKRNEIEFCFKDGSKRYFNPIIDWTADEVWEYIHEYKVPYCKLYDEGFKRLGCIMCPYQGRKGMLRDADRWPKYAAAYKRACKNAYDKGVIDGLDRKSWTCGEDIYNWWLQSPVAEKGDPDQTVMFE